MSFYVVSVKDRIQSTGNIMYPPYCYQAFSDGERLERQILVGSYLPKL
jgi:hypothetical protein